MSTPNSHQMSILKLMAAGVELHAPEPLTSSYRLILKSTAAGVLRPATVKALVTNGWIEPHASGRWILTKLGRGHAECFTFVRAFTDAPVS